jgi:hypothetical protein
MLAPALHWVDPGTHHQYPMSYRAYRRAREAEEKPLPRHRCLGPDVDHYLWRHRQGQAALGEVRLTFRPGAPPRVQRIVAEILRAIRRGQPPAAAIRRVATRFGLRHNRARAIITANLGFEMRSRPHAAAFVTAGWPPDSSLASRV